jgi:large subunit ribosomal protein L34e
VVRSGLKKLRGAAFGRLTSGQRTVTRPYGGVLSHEEVKGRYVTLFLLILYCRIVRAFLIEEVKLMKKLLQQKDKTGKKKKSKGKKPKK